MANERMWASGVFETINDPVSAARYAAVEMAPIEAVRRGRASQQEDMAAGSLFAVDPAQLRKAAAAVVLVEDPDTGEIAAGCHILVDGTGVGRVQGLIRTASGDSLAPRLAVARAVDYGAERGVTAFAIKVRIYPHGRFTDGRGAPITENGASRRLFEEDFGFASQAIATFPIVGDWRDSHLSASAEPDGTFRTRIMHATPATIPLARTLLNRLANGRAA